MSSPLVHQDNLLKMINLSAIREFLLPLGRRCFNEIVLYQIANISKRLGQVTQAVSGFVLGSTTISELRQPYHLASQVFCKVLVDELLNVMDAVVILARVIR